MFSGLPPKADFPILELLPPPALRKRRHRGLARCRLAVRRRARYAAGGRTDIYTNSIRRTLAFLTIPSGGGAVCPPSVVT